MYLTSLVEKDMAPSEATALVSLGTTEATPAFYSGVFRIRSNTLGQIRSRHDASGVTRGWKDRREQGCVLSC